MRNNWKYVSENTTDALSLHDCDCTHIYYENGSVILEMEWMEVMSYHPKNEFPEAHQSGVGVIEFIEPQIIECIYTKKGVQQEVCDLSMLEFRNLEFIEFNETKDEYGFVNKMFLINIFRDEEYDNVSLELRYKSSIVRFNELNDVSWFESI